MKLKEYFLLIARAALFLFVLFNVFQETGLNTSLLMATLYVLVELDFIAKRNYNKTFEKFTEIIDSQTEEIEKDHDPITELSERELKFLGDVVINRILERQLRGDKAIRKILKPE